MCLKHFICYNFKGRMTGDARFTALIPGLKAFLEPSLPQAKGAVSPKLRNLSHWHIPKWANPGFNLGFVGHAS